MSLQAVKCLPRKPDGLNSIPQPMEKKESVYSTKQFDMYAVACAPLFTCIIQTHSQ